MDTSTVFFISGSPRQSLNINGATESIAFNISVGRGGHPGTCAAMGMYFSTGGSVRVPLLFIDASRYRAVPDGDRYLRFRDLLPDLAEFVHPLGSDRTDDQEDVGLPRVVMDIDAGTVRYR